jgi:hypothetical protein
MTITTTTAAPATKAPAKAPAKTVAKKAPAKAPAKKAAPTNSSSKIRWSLDGEKDNKNRAPQHGTGANGVEYRIAGSGDSWTATATVDGKVEVLAEGGHTKTFQACVKRNAEALAA